MRDPLLDVLFRRPAPRRRQSRVLQAVLWTGLFLVAASLAAFPVARTLRLLTGAFSAVRAIPDVKDRYTLENEFLKDAVQALGALLLLVGFYFTNRTINISREGQVTDRFNKAVDHLGSDKIEIRIGGICALSRIARDSVMDRVEIAELLCAFIQERTQSHTNELLDRDIRSAIRTLGEDWNESLPDGIIDLSNTKLANADLRTLRFDSASFEGANLRGANFASSSLRSCNLAGASCVGAYFRNADLRGANLTAADLSDASLRDCEMEGASLLGSNLRNTSLIGTKMSSARFITRDQLEEALVDDTTRLPALDIVQVNSGNTSETSSRDAK